MKLSMHVWVNEFLFFYIKTCLFKVKSVNLCDHNLSVLKREHHPENDAVQEPYSGSIIYMNVNLSVK